MSLNDDFKKAAQLEKAALNKLNQEESWVERHPGWTTLIGVALFVALVVSIVKSCH